MMETAGGVYGVTEDVLTIRLSKLALYWFGVLSHIE